MCDCIPSIPLTYSSARIEKPGHARCISEPRICRTQLLRKVDSGFFAKPLIACDLVHVGVKNGRIQFIKGELKRNEGEVESLKSMNCINENRNSGVLGVENYSFYDELGIKNRDEKTSDLETQSLGVGEEEKFRLNPQADGPIDFSTREKEVNRSNEESVSSSFDFLELKSDLEKEKRKSRRLGHVMNDDLVQIEGSARVNSKFDEPNQQNLGSRRQMIRRSNVLAKQVISMQSALTMGFVSQLWVDTSSWMVLVVEVRPSLLSGEVERFLLDDVQRVGDVVLVQDESVIENEFKMIDLDTLVGYNVVTPNRRNIGKVRGYTFNMESGAVELLELDSFGISVIPSSLVNTYGLFVEDVLEVAFDTVVVHEAAASRIQRLTKGFWNTRNVETSKEELREDSYPERPVRTGYDRRSQRHYSSRKFPSDSRQTDDDWELPMDYL